ncbi:TPA_asm: hypothetical protein, partial [ssRNA phage Gerhypos.2_12]
TVTYGAIMLSFGISISPEVSISVSKDELLIFRRGVWYHLERPRDIEERIFAVIRDCSEARSDLDQILIVNHAADKLMSQVSST